MSREDEARDVLNAVSEHLGALAETVMKASDKIVDVLDKAVEFIDEVVVEFENGPVDEEPPPNSTQANTPLTEEDVSRIMDGYFRRLKRPF